MTASESLPTDLAAAHAMIIAERAARLEAEAVAASAKAEAANAKAAEALISYLKLEIEKLRRQLFGSHSERKARLLEQIELQLEELEAAATEDELAAEKAAARTPTVKPLQRKRPSRGGRAAGSRRRPGRSRSRPSGRRRRSGRPSARRES